MQFSLFLGPAYLKNPKIGFLGFHSNFWASSVITCPPQHVDDGAVFCRMGERDWGVQYFSIRGLD